MNTKPTRRDVARLAGVSTATVSNVVNRSGKVKEETVLRVQRAIDRLHYRPDMVARSLTTGKTMQIGIVLEDVLNPFYGEIVREFENAAGERDYFVSVCTGLRKLDGYFDSAVTRGLDGIFVTALPYKFRVEKLYRLVDCGVRVLTSGNVNVDRSRVSSIEQDYESGMAAAIRHLYRLGHRRIAYLSGLGRSQTFDLRCVAYRRCAAELRLPDAGSLLVSGEAPYTTNVRDGYNCAARLLRSGKRFTAAGCGNDLMAIGAIRAFRESGLRVPQDVSVVGFDGIEIGRFCDPPLTTMSLDKERFGRKAFELLYRGMACGETASCTEGLTLLEGGSTAPCPSAP